MAKFEFWIEVNHNMLIDKHFVEYQKINSMLTYENKYDEMIKERFIVWYMKNKVMPFLIQRQKRLREKSVRKIQQMRNSKNCNLVINNKIDQMIEKDYKYFGKDKIEEILNIYKKVLNDDSPKLARTNL